MSIAKLVMEGRATVYRSNYGPSSPEELSIFIGDDDLLDTVDEFIGVQRGDGKRYRMTLEEIGEPKEAP